FRFDVDERNVVAVAKEGDHLLRLGQAQQSVVHEHAGELFTDSFVNEDGSDRRIDAPRQSADDASATDLGANYLDRLRLERAHGPVAPAAGDLAHEVAQ